MPKRVLTLEDFGEFASVLDLNAALIHLSLTGPSEEKIVALEVAAMRAYVAEHGRGPVDEALRSLQHRTPPRDGMGASVSESADDEGATPVEEVDHRERLMSVASLLLSALDAQNGPKELGKAAVAAAVEAAGTNLLLRPRDESPNSEIIVSDFSFDLTDGIALLRVPNLGPGLGDRVAAVVSQWSAGESLPKAVILDLSTCRGGRPVEVAKVGNLLAPGRHLFDTVIRAGNEHSDKAERSTRRSRWRGSAQFAVGRFDRIPVFVLVSDQTGPLAEVLVVALRHYRSATVLGQVTQGTGRVFRWIELPWGEDVGVPFVEFFGPDGSSLAGKPVIPDACLTAEGLKSLRERTLDAYNERCPRNGRTLVPADVIDYVRRHMEPPADDKAPSVPAQGSQQGESKA